MRIPLQVYIGAHRCINQEINCPDASSRKVSRVNNLDNFVCHHNGTCTRPFNTYQCYRGCRKGIEGSDIAVITLDRPVQLSNKIRPICLPANPRQEQFEKKTAVIAGWGMFDNANKTSQLPREAEVKVLKFEGCYGQWNYNTSDGKPVAVPWKDDEGMERSGWGADYNETVHLCTHGPRGNGPRAGDSGSALNFKENGRFSTLYYLYL